MDVLNFKNKTPLQMAYDKTDGGRTLRKYCGLALCWWHNYKHVAQVLWKTYAREFFAPMFHFLYPGTEFYVENKNFPQLLAHLQMVQIAYAAVRPKLLKVLENPPIRHDGLLAAKELHFILDFAIPTVSAVFVCHSTFIPTQCSH